MDAFSYETDLQALAATADDHTRCIIRGLLWAIRSCRVSGEVAHAIRTCTAAELQTLVVAAAAACRVMGETPAFLRDYFIHRQPALPLLDGREAQPRC